MVSALSDFFGGMIFFSGSVVATPPHAARSRMKVERHSRPPPAAARARRGISASATPDEPSLASTLVGSHASSWSSPTNAIPSAPATWCDAPASAATPRFAGVAASRMRKLSNIERRRPTDASSASDPPPTGAACGLDFASDMNVAGELASDRRCNSDFRGVSATRSRSSIVTTNWTSHYY